MKCSAEERKFWRDVFRARVRSVGAGVAECYAQESVALYRERFGNRPAGVPPDVEERLWRDVYVARIRCVAPVEAEAYADLAVEAWCKWFGGRPAASHSSQLDVVEGCDGWEAMLRSSSAEERRLWRDVYVARARCVAPWDAAECAEGAVVAWCRRFRRPATLGNSQLDSGEPVEPCESMVLRLNSGAEGRRLWRDVYVARMRCDGEFGAEAHADEAIVLYCKRHGSCPETPSSAPDETEVPPAAFAGEPEPITEEVLREVGLRPCDANEWRGNSRADGNLLLMRYVDGGTRLHATITDARKLRAIMEILRA